LIVYSLDQDRSTYSLSCFVTKLHFRLRYAGIPYENGLGTRGQAPKEKFPYVKFVDSGELLGDTALIVKRLVEQGRLEDLNAGLAPEERAVDYCLRAMLEDRLYYLVNFERWYENYKMMRDQGPFGHLPGGIRHVTGFFTSQYLKMMLYFQGTGRHSPEEVRHFRAEAIGALADFASTARGKAAQGNAAPFWILGGERPTEADFTLFGCISGYLANQLQPDTTAVIKSHPTLVDYVERIHTTYFSDFR
ncbi:hypothetical protein B0T25DRAFT_416961, partial [Lasiosphaeria hispida]